MRVLVVDDSTALAGGERVGVGRNKARLVMTLDKEAKGYIDAPGTAPDKKKGRSQTLDNVDDDEVLALKDRITAYNREFLLHDSQDTEASEPVKPKYPWNIVYGNLHKDNIVVAGDALHSMTPDLGKGGSSSLEDAVVLGRHIGESFIRNGGLVPQDISRALDEYVKERKWRYWRTAALVAGGYFSGWAQQIGSSWFKMLIVLIFYKFAFSRIMKFTRYDCGKLPTTMPP